MSCFSEPRRSASSPTAKTCDPQLRGEPTSRSRARRRITANIALAPSRRGQETRELQSLGGDGQDEERKPPRHDLVDGRARRPQRRCRPTQHAAPSDEREREQPPAAGGRCRGTPRAAPRCRRGAATGRSALHPRRRRCRRVRPAADRDRPSSGRSRPRARARSRPRGNRRSSAARAARPATRPARERRSRAARAPRPRR